MARPSEKLCRPMPVAMSTASLAAGDRWWPGRSGASSSTAAAPGPKRRDATVASPVSSGFPTRSMSASTLDADPGTATLLLLQRSKYTRLSSPTPSATVKVETRPVNLHQLP